MKKARIDNNGWCRCGKCGRKLFHVEADNFKVENGAIVIEIKCHSCREINDLVFCS